MAITLTQINAKDNLGKLRVDFNNNMTAIEDEFAGIEAVLNTSTGNVTGNNMSLNRGSRAISTEIAVIDGSARIKGSLAVEDTVTSSNISVTSGGKILVPNGNVTVSGNTSNFTSEGTSFFGYNVILKDYGSTALDASNIGTYSSVSANIGTIVPNGKHAMILDFSNYSSSANVNNTHTVRDIILGTGVHQGQILELTVLANSSSGKPHYLMANNIISLGASEKIEFNADYCAVTLRYSGNSWIIRNTFKANIV